MALLKDLGIIFEGGLFVYFDVTNLKVMKGAVTNENFWRKCF
jgi:hypothetical protein